MCLSSEPRGHHYPACAVIVARGGSKRLPGKNVRTVGGRAVLARAIDACREAGDMVGIVAVTTDSGEYAAVAHEAGARVVKRPDALAGDTARIDEGAAHAVRELFPACAPDWTLIVQPNIPLWEPDTVSRIVERAMRGDCTAVVTGHAIHERPEWAMRLGGGYLHRCQPNPVAVNCQELDHGIYHIDGQVVCVRTETLLSDFPRIYLGPCGDRIALHEHDRVWGTDVDTVYDLLSARAVHEQLVLEGRL